MKCPKAISIKSWKDLIESFDSVASDGNQWVFRGLPNSEWKLETSFEYALLNFEHTDFKDGKERLDHLRQVLRGEKSDLLLLEGGLLRHFTRRYHHYAQHVPEKNNYVEWFALMRHHGAPTRLLDWTYSFFIACYFALEESKGKCAVWALDTSWLDQTIKKMKGKFAWDIQCSLNYDPHLTQSNTVNKLIWNGKTSPFVVAINPLNLNQRLAAQQGVFLCQGDISQPFADNLDATLSAGDDYSSHFRKYKFDIDTHERRGILKRLYSMGISRVTLFPDLDGFARSLNQMIVFPWIKEPGLDFPISKNG